MCRRLLPILILVLLGAPAAPAQSCRLSLEAAPERPDVRAAQQHVAEPRTQAAERLVWRPALCQAQKAQKPGSEGKLQVIGHNK